MTRNLRNHDQDEIKDENGIVHTTKRSLRKINYADIENLFDSVDEEPEIDQDSQVQNEFQPIKEPIEEPEPYNDNNNDDGEDDDDDDNIQNPSSNGRKRKNHHYDNEDESFHEDDIDEDEDDIDEDEDDEYDEYGSDSKNRQARERNRMDRNFVVQDPEDFENGGDDDDDSDDENVYHGSTRRGRRSTRIKRVHREQEKTPPRRNLRSTTMYSHIPNTETDHERKNLTLADEIRELQDDSPIQEKRSLRERTKPVNYTLPPPLSAANAEELTKQQTGSFNNISPSRRGGRNWNSMGPARRLFPTGGPFGGNDVTTIFGQNTNFYGNQNLNLNPNDQNNKLILDSDSSEDEILPLGATPKSKNDNPLKKKKKKAEIADLDPLGVDMNISFDEVGGLDNYIDQLKEMVTLPLLYPELYQNFNILPPRGVLFHGPPGTGKTLMARALAASCSSETRKITFFMRKGADILSKWVGEAERQLRLLFEEAKKQQPSIIFFDEIDGLAPVRSSKQEQIHASIVSTMLALMDGMDNRGQVIVIGATNRPDAVDPALRRPGRFDREFYFPLPDEKARATIIKIQTKKWNPSLPDQLVDGLAKLTKGYGGADLRALCTEAALSSIQRKFPQIYRNNDKLSVDPKKLRVKHKDFMLALKKIVPSSARQAGSNAEPLPNSVKPLLTNQFNQIKSLLDNIIPDNNSTNDKNSSSIQHYIDYEDSDSDDEDYTKIDGFNKYEMLNEIRESRVCNPRLLIAGSRGSGQQYIGAAVLNYLENYNVQKLDLGTLVSESTRSMEAAVVQGFIEARKRQPSIIFIPNIDIWSKSVPISVVSTLASLFGALKSKEKVLLLGVAETPENELMFDESTTQLFFHDSIYNIEKPQISEREEYFKSIVNVLKMKPNSFNTERKRSKPLAKLPVVPINSLPENIDDEGKPLSADEILRRKLKKFQYHDMKLKNVLKIKLSGLMDLFKNRYKRFRKPTVDDSFLVHLFEPSTDPNWQPLYIKDGHMILEVSTGRKFYNMDLDIVEERLWNGYYSEPKQFLRDIELIYLDANTMGDRERVIKASEMFANAQMGIEDLSTPELVKECKITRKRDEERQQLYLKQLEKEKISNATVNDTDNGTGTGTETADDEKTNMDQNKSAGLAKTNNLVLNEVGVAAGNQLQAQLEISSNTLDPDNIPVQDATELDATQPVEIVPTNVSAGTEDVGSPDANEVGEIESSSMNQPEQTVANVNTTETANTPIENTNSKSTEPETEKEDVPTEPVKTEKAVDNREITMNEAHLNSIITKLLAQTDDCVVFELEQIYAKIMRIVWETRLEWDKSATLSRLDSYIQNLNK